MLTRQKAILSLLKRANNPLSIIVLVKLAFLISKETDILNKSSFYDFLPYKYGPFSFSLYRELESLTNYGYVNWENDFISISTDNVDIISKFDNDLNDNQKESIDFIFDKYGKIDKNLLLKYIYNKYPWYAQNSSWKELIPVDKIEKENVKPAINTIGYQGMSIDLFISFLIEQGIQLIADVRHNPVSRKYGFAKSSLSRIANNLNIVYINTPSLGIPSSDRKNLENENVREVLFDNYEKITLSKSKSDITNLVSTFNNIPSVLVCAERDVQTCHRFRLAKKMSEESGLPINHLSIGDNGKNSRSDYGQNIPNSLFDI